MTRDDIIRMAREAGLASIYSACDEPGVRCAYEDWDEELERFAAFVAAAERQRCADICDQHASIEGIAQRCAVEIRARNK
jgi:cobalamin biosynthesis protein CbiG